MGGRALPRRRAGAFQPPHGVGAAGRHVARRRADQRPGKPGVAGRPDRHADRAELRATPRRVRTSRAASAYGAARLALRLAAAGARHRPLPRSGADRLATLPRRGLPVEAPVEIYWNNRLVPFIEARTDRDLAGALGLVHAHLRLA